MARDSAEDSPYATSWHLTDNPQFALDPAHVPEDNTFALQQRTAPGLYVGDPEKWLNGYDYVRPYAAEIEHPSSDQGRWGGESFIPAEQFPQTKVKRVIPLDEYSREAYGEPGWIEGALDYANTSYHEQPRYPNYRYEGPDVRDMSPEEHARHQERADQYIREVRPHILRRYDEDGEPVEYGDPRWEKYAMAERSGFPELDAAIEEFMAAHPEVEDFRDPQNAWGQCEEIADECAAFLKARGFKAYAPRDEIAAFPGYQDAQDSAAIGAGTFSYPEHAMVEVYGLYGPNNIQNVTIDFTASQYGFSEFPKVHGGPSESERTIAKVSSQEWRRGMYGKGVVTPEGDVHHWRIEEATGRPNHDEYVRSIGLSPIGGGRGPIVDGLRGPSGLAFGIEPDGALHMSGGDSSLWPIAVAAHPDWHRPEASGKVAAMTPNQQARFRQGLEATYGPEETKTIHQYPDGWTIQHLPTWNELGREGEMMHHCWAGMGSPSPDQTVNGVNYPGSKLDRGPYPGDDWDTGIAVSLRDPNNWPHASFTYDPAEKVAYEFGGHGGFPDLGEDHERRIAEWADERGIAHPFDPESYGE